jgi:PKD repeat protein
MLKKVAAAGIVLVILCFFIYVLLFVQSIPATPVQHTDTLATSTSKVTGSRSLFSAVPYGAAVPLTVFFDIADAAAGKTFTINFGDGSKGTLTYAHPVDCARGYSCSASYSNVHVYAIPGTYFVTVTDGTTVVGTSTINARLHDGIFSAAPEKGSAPLRVTFSWIHGHDPIYEHMSVDFGDGGSQDVSSYCLLNERPCDPLTHTYTSPGTFTAKLKTCGLATASCQTAITATANVTVQ